MELWEKAAPDVRWEWLGAAREKTREGSQGYRPTPQLHLYRPLNQARSYALKSVRR
jgi:hypothetical protein